MFKKIAWGIVAFLLKKYPRLTKEEWDKILSVCEKSKPLWFCENPLPQEDLPAFSSVDTKVHFKDDYLASVTQFCIWGQGDGMRGTLTFVGFPKSDDLKSIFGQRGKLSLIVGCLDKEQSPTKKTILEEEVLFSDNYDFCLSIDDIVTDVSVDFEVIKPLAQG
jgi:hypothetical protein